MRHTIIPTIMLAAILSKPAMSGEQENQTTWEQDIVFHPTHATLEAESRGKVWVLSGMWDFEVETAMASQFDRAEHFMFVQTKHLAPAGAGSEMWQEEDCD